MKALAFLGVCGLLLLHGDTSRANEQVALAALKKAGCVIRTDASKPGMPVVFVQFPCLSPATDADLAYLKDIPTVEQVLIVSDRVTDAGLASLASLPNLKSLGIFKAKITDQGLEHLKTLTKLKQVSFRWTKVTENGAKELGKALPEAKVTWKP